jgi:predicted neuraminidase
VADGGQPDGTRHPTWNPVLFKAPRGPLFLFYKVGPSPSDWWGMLKTSSDGGRTWSEARRLPAPLLGPIKNKPVVLRDGSWLSASSTEGTPMGWRAHFEVSRDAGETWEFVGPLDKGVSSLEAIQGSVLFHRDGRLQALLRTRNGVLATTWSSDSGRTWSALAPSGLPNPNAGTDAITLKDGRQLLVYNHAAPAPGTTSGPRYPLNVAVSTDGVAWPMVLTLEAEPIPDGYAYPAVIQSADGLVHVTYTWNRRRIKHVVIDPRELAQDGQNQQCDPVGPRRGALDLVGIPAFQWIQDPIDYSTRVHHTNMDVFDHLVPEDLIQSAVITASFVYPRSHARRDAASQAVTGTVEVPRQEIGDARCGRRCSCFSSLRTSVNRRASAAGEAPTAINLLGWIPIIWFLALTAWQLVARGYRWIDATRPPAPGAGDFRVPRLC